MRIDTKEIYIGSRLGKLSDLPESIRSELSIEKKKSKSSLVLEAMKKLDGIASIDEILVTVYRDCGVIFKRAYLSNFMYRLCSRGIVSRVKRRKGIYEIVKEEL